MTIKKLLKDLIPPIFLKLVNKSRKNILQPEYKSYQDALAAAGS